MRLRPAPRRLVAATALALAAVPARAAAPPTGARAAAVTQEWVASAGAGVAAPLRQQVDVAWNRAARPALWQRFTAAVPGRWFASWDRATAVPARIWGEGVAAPGASADPDAALAAARAFLAAHVDLLAPGSTADDFELVANVTDGDIRSVGFVQRHGGLRVVGGQVGFEFKRDRLFVIHSDALPDVQVPASVLLDAGALAPRARAATLAELGLPDARVGAPGDAVILPLVGDAGVLGYRVAVPLDVDAGADGRWTVYADASSGAPIARHLDVAYSSADVQYDAVVRWRGRPRSYYPAQRMHATVDGNDQTSGADGSITWSDTAPAQVTARTVGDLVRVVNMQQTAQVLGTTVPPGGAVQWSLAADELLDAEIDPFVHVQIAKAYVRRYAPQLAFLDAQLEVDTDLPYQSNTTQQCNAYFSGDVLHFITAGGGCGNTGTMADVIYHEFEHGVHAHSVVPGLGATEGALGEGQSDVLAALITGDPGMGRGFKQNDDPLRDIDTGIDYGSGHHPKGANAVWPDDLGEIHTAGLIYSGALWDLRTALYAELGAGAAEPVVDHLYYAVVQRANNIPSTLIETLAGDDDDGNLANGTPHECEILAAFAAHGLRTWQPVTDQPGSVAAPAGQTTTPIGLTLAGRSPRCPADQPTAITMKWTARSGSKPPDGSADMLIGADDAHFTADLPLPPDGIAVQYQINLAFADGTHQTLPDNLADPWYLLYQGPTVPLYCTDFETDPFAAGWNHRAGHGTDQWQWGEAAGTRYDPAAAFSGTHLVGTALGGTGVYADATDQQLVSPVIDLGKYSDVHLQYRRYLSVGDGHSEQATIYANTESAWANAASASALGRDIQHIDREWIFADVPLSGHVSTGTTVQVTFDLASAGGAQLGGWNVDDVCVVANAKAYCGDGMREGAEQCDNGAANADAPDKCRTYCRVPRCGDGIVDSNEECDDGNTVNGDTCTSKCMVPPATPPQGCCEAGDAPAGGALVGAMVVAAALTRSRRRRRR